MPNLHHRKPSGELGKDSYSLFWAFGYKLCHFSLSILNRYQVVTDFFIEALVSPPYLFSSIRQTKMLVLNVDGSHDKMNKVCIITTKDKTRNAFDIIYHVFWCRKVDGTILYALLSFRLHLIYQM